MDELQGFPYSSPSIQKLCVILLFKLSKNIYIHKAGIPDSEKTRPSKELSRLGPGLPWPLLSCRSWSLTLAAETHDRVWTGAADRRGEAWAHLCASSSAHTPAAMVEPQAGHSFQVTTSRTCPLGRPWPLPLSVARPAESHCKLLQQVQIQVNRDICASGLAGAWVNLKAKTQWRHSNFTWWAAQAMMEESGRPSGAYHTLHGVW